MKENKWLIVVTLVLVLFIGFKFISKTKSDDPVSKTNYIMGTIVKLNIYDDVDEEVFENTFDLIRNIENKMSLKINNSEVNKINKNAYREAVDLSDEMHFILEKSIEYSKISDGYFDITIGSLVELWAIGTDDAKVPSQNEIQDAILTVDYKNIDLALDNIKLKRDATIIDLGAIAKGYAADQSIKYLKSQNIKRAIVDIGGNIYALGSKSEEEPWKIGIQNPFTESRGDFLGTVKVSDKSIVTSGVYERYFESNGKKYHHILNPFTGYPIENELMSVTIISKESIDGDALSTAVFSLGLRKGYELLESLDDVEAIFVTKDKDIYITPKARDIFSIDNTDFKVKRLK